MGGPLPLPALADAPDLARWKHEIDDERIRISYGQLVTVSLGSLATSAATALILHGTMRDAYLYAWVAAVWLNAFGRIALARWFHARPRHGAELRRWHAALAVVFAIAASIYGSIVLLPPGHPPLEVIAIAGLTIGGTIGGATIALGSTPWLVVAVCVPLAIPLIVVSAISPHDAVQGFLLMFASFLLMVASNARQNYQRVMASLALRYENRDLAERLAQRKEMAEAASRDKTRFLAAASHDLRQPLHALVLFTSALDAEPHSERGKHLLGRVQLSIEALQRLLDGLLDISRLDAGVIAPRPRRFAATALARQIETLFAEPARDRGLRLRVVAPADLWIDADPDMAAQLVRNLVANAIRYTNTGRVVVCFRRRAGRVRVQVWDTGIGITADQRTEIFREFYQVGNPERDRSRGVGLGLAIVERIARLLETRVELRSEPGKGSVFWFDLPAAPPADAADSAHQLALAAPPSSLGRLLIVDDDALAREGLCAALEAWGYTVVGAEGPEQAAELAARHPDLDAVICDFRLREHGTATDALAAIAARLGRTPPAVIVTGETDPARIRRAHDTGHAVLFKPVEPEQLRSALDRLIT